MAAMTSTLSLQQPAAPSRATREQAGPSPASRPFVALSGSALAPRRHLQAKRGLRVSRAAEEKVEVVPLGAAAKKNDDDLEWIPVIAPEDLPKGVRKEVKVAGRSLLLFWYRNQIYCIEARSPAEGAYSEGLIKGKFTQEFEIECPTTGTLFSLKDGSITSWYPTNPVLRALTPQCRPLELYPVKLQQDAICVAVDSSAMMARSRGGADTSLESNNVFSLEPRVYVGEEEAEGSSGGAVGQAITGIVALVGLAGLGVGGLAVGEYFDSPVLTVLFGVAFLGVAGTYIASLVKGNSQ